MSTYPLPQSSAPRRRRRRRRAYPLLWPLGMLLAADAVLFCLTLRTEPQSKPDISTSISASSPSAPETGTADADAVVPAPSVPPDEEDAPLDAEYIPDELLELLEKNPETLDFVREYPEKHELHPEIDLTAEAQSETVPLLLQWDERWGYERYGDGLIGYTGCGPTCLSMAALYLTGDASYTPLAVAQYADSSGYYVDGKGTAWSFMTDGAAHFGLYAEELSLSERRMREALDAGKPIICVVGPGDFTPSGHFIVLTGYTGEGFTVNDPNSIIRSGQVWSFETLRGQIRNLWAFSCL